MTNTQRAFAAKHDFDAIQARGGHAALVFYPAKGELALICSRAKFHDKMTWGFGAVPANPSDNCVRVCEC